MSVEQMLSSMSSDEITYWKAFFELENEDADYAKLKAKR